MTRHGLRLLVVMSLAASTARAGFPVPIIGPQPVNGTLLRFLRANYSPGRIVLIGSSDGVGMLFRNCLAGATADRFPSKWSHAFIFGPRDSGDSDIVIYESTLYASVGAMEFENGVRASTLQSCCAVGVDHACVLDPNLTTRESDSVLGVAREIIGRKGPWHTLYPLGELTGLLWGLATRSLHAPNVFDDPRALQCSSFVRTCFAAIGKEVTSDDTDITNTTPETFYQSERLQLVAEWEEE